MKSDPAREHHERMRALEEEWGRKLAFQAQRAYLDVSDVYWITHDFLNALLSAEGHRTEEELGHAITTLKHDFLAIPPDLAKQWQAFFIELSHAQYGGSKPNPEEVHLLFVHARSLINDTLHIAVEPTDEFTRHIQALRVLVANKEVLKAEEHYRGLVTEYDKLPEEQKAQHYPRFREVYQSIVAARNAQRA